jgi:uncharacterized oligopeptide transporter (OPT) family protein
VGHHVALSMLLGSAIGWGVLAPWLVHGPLHIAVRRDALSDWLSWPGTALLVGAATFALLRQAGAVRDAIRDIGSLTRRSSETKIGEFAIGLSAVVVTIVVGQQVFGLRPWHTAIGLVLSVIGASICARSAGLTDISPLGPIGQLTQLIYGLVAPGVPSVNVAAGSIVAGDATQTPVSLWSLRAGRSMRAPVRPQIAAALVGCVVGAAICVPTYSALARVYGLGSVRLPVPTGQQWKTVASMVAQGFTAVPAGAAAAVIVGAIVGVLFAASLPSRFARYVPSPIAMGIGLLVPFEYSIAIATGSAFLGIARRYRPEFWSGYGAASASGLIAGDSLIGLLAALLTSAGVL